MYPKFILVSDPQKPLTGTFVYGLVWNHRDLVQGYVKVHGGGWFEKDDEKKTIQEILDIVDNETEIEETRIETAEDTNIAVSGPSSPHSGPVMMGPPAPVQEDNDEGEVFDVVEENPSFPGGDAALMTWLQKNLKYPAAAQENGIQGRVLVSFIVNKDGSIVEPKIIRSVDPSLDKEAARVVSSMPRWKPGKQRGKAVRVKYTLPVTFRLQ